MESINFRKTKFLKAAATIKQCPDQELPEVVLCGRSNVGKSSLVNALADNSKLARTSASPGKTRQVVYFEVDKRLLIADLPGYGYAKVSREKSQAFSSLCDDYFTSGRKISLALILLDIRREPSDKDVMMLDYLNHTDIPYFIVFTKCDKMSRSQCLTRQRALADSFNFSPDASIYAISADKKLGIKDLADGIASFIDSLG